MRTLSEASVDMLERIYTSMLTQHVNLTGVRGELAYNYSIVTDDKREDVEREMLGINAVLVHLGHTMNSIRKIIDTPCI